MHRLWILLLVGLTSCGDAPPADISSRIGKVRDSLLPAVLVRGEAPATIALADRMAELNVPAVSVALIDEGRIAWAQAWGMADVASRRVATTATLFQAASISKPVAATAALTLVADGQLDLDADVNQYLDRWQVPGTAFTSEAPVTLRRLLTHTAGLTVHGFPGYERNDSIPDAVGVLDGLGNTDPIRVDTTPGALWRYSGGGYTVVQQLLADVTGLPFADILRQRVLDPMGMASSTYEQPLPQTRWLEAATAYGSDGEPVDGGWHVYPEQAAAGLWTTPTDLARWGLAILSAYDGAQGGVLSPATARAMLTPGLNRWGLGPGIGEDRAWFGHGGSNAGFKCQLIVFFDGRGAAVMTNGDRGHELIQQVLGTLALEYGWPDFRPLERTVAHIDPAVLDAMVGSYRLEELDGEIEITAQAGRLYLTFPRYRSEILPESDSVFFAREDGDRFTVIRKGERVVAIERDGMRAVRAN